MKSTSACLIANDIAFVGSNNRMQSVNIRGSTPQTLYTFSTNPDAITMDAVGPYLFVPCATCSFNGATVLSPTGTLLARINYTVTHAVAKPSKYPYRLVLADSSQMFLYEVWITPSWLFPMPANNLMVLRSVDNISRCSLSSTMRENLIWQSSCAATERKIVFFPSEYLIQWSFSLIYKKVMWIKRRISKAKRKYWNDVYTQIKKATTTTSFWSQNLFLFIRLHAWRISSVVECGHLRVQLLTRLATRLGQIDVRQGKFIHFD